ncbi:hypothetical protein [Flavobacterium soyae]|uniref:hypothetical protein n=1 Tax=Flavobacterium soyae TaxID=2903098 RepID=UPI0034D975A6
MSSTQKPYFLFWVISKDGKIYIIGGNNGKLLSEIETFDLITENGRQKAAFFRFWKDLPLLIMIISSVFLKIKKCMHMI